MCLSFFNRKPIVEPETVDPQSTIEIELAELHTLLTSTAPDANIILADNWKYLCSYEDVALFLAQDQTNKVEYISEEFDCDDFSFRLKGQFSIPGWAALALGICWTNNHALNCFVDEDKKLWFIEPQNDTITDVLENIRLIIM
jgi:hypothetical protein|tara:strand:- start:4581 stop:5009 length:429 start_codon:yes stop_codon:yes gene_type:complete